MIEKLKKLIHLDSYDQCVAEASVKIVTMFIGENNQGGVEWVNFLADKLGNLDNKKGKISDPMIMPIVVHLLKHEALADAFISQGGFRII